MDDDEADGGGATLSRAEVEELFSPATMDRYRDATQVRSYLFARRTLPHRMRAMSSPPPTFYHRSRGRLRWQVGKTGLGLKGNMTARRRSQYDSSMNSEAHGPPSTSGLI